MIGNIVAPLRTAIAGIGGFAAAHHQVFAEYDQLGDTRVIATCDPKLAELSSISESRSFETRQVAAYTTFEEMMLRHGSHLDLAVIATPIQVHARMHECCVRNQIACYLEKPPTLDPLEFDQMVAVEKEAGRQTHVGFDYIHVEERLALKRRMIAGEFGALKRVSFLGLSQRATDYFHRNSWAGRLTFGDRLLLDSCVGNAMAHQIHMMLFFAGQREAYEWARPERMNAELFRANPIQGPDSIFAVGMLKNGVEFRIAASHTCANLRPIFRERFEFEQASVEINSCTEVSIVGAKGDVEHFAIPAASLAKSVRSYLDYLRGRTPRPAVKLEDCRAFVDLNALFYLSASRIHPVDPRFLISVPTKSPLSSALAISGIENACEETIINGVLPSQTTAKWAAKGGTNSIENLGDLRSYVQALAANDQ